MNKINVEKVIDYTKVLKDNEILQDMDKILRNENTNLKLEIESLNNKIQYLQADYGNKAQVERDLLIEENKRLNNIIKEAIEYIEQVGVYSDYGDEGIQSENDLLKILKGSDKE